jgi:hypothetical protein
LRIEGKLLAEAMLPIQMESEKVEIEFLCLAGGAITESCGSDDGMKKAAYPSA